MKRFVKQNRQSSQPTLPLSLKAFSSLSRLHWKRDKNTKSTCSCCCMWGSDHLYHFFSRGFLVPSFVLDYTHTWSLFYLIIKKISHFPWEQFSFFLNLNIYCVTSLWLSKSMGNKIDLLKTIHNFFKKIFFFFWLNQNCI